MKICGTEVLPPLFFNISALLLLGTAEQGKKVFKKCAACHSINQGGANKIGPALYGVLGRKVASKVDYKYSKAMANYNKNWTFEEMNAFLGVENVRKLRAENIIEICPLEYMRGRNFHNAFMILDEAQNATFEQIKMFLTRLGRNSRCVINGDIDQSDLMPRLRGALDICTERLDNTKGVSIVELDEDDIVRNKIIARVLAKLDFWDE